MDEMYPNMGQMNGMNPNMNQGNYSYDPYGRKPSNKTPIIIAGVIGLLTIILIGIIVFLFVFSSPKNVYLDLERRNVTAFVESLEEFKNSDLGTLLLPDQTKPLEYGMTISADVDVDGANDVMDILNNSKIEVIAQQDLAKEYSFVNLNVLLDNKDFFDADMVLSKNMLGVTVKDLVDKYVIVDTQNLQPLYDKIGYTEEGPNRIITNKELLEVLELTKNEKKTLEKAAEKYSKIFVDNLDKDNVEIIKNKEVRIAGEKVKANVAEVTLTQEYLLESSKVAIEMLKEDDELIDLWFGKLEDLMALYEDAGYPMEGELELDKEDFIDELDEMLEDLEDTEPEDENYITMKVFYNNKKQIIKRELHSSDEYSEPIIISTYAGKDNRYYAIEVDGEVMEYEVKVDGKQEKHELSIEDFVINANVDKSDKNKTNVEITSKDLDGFKLITSLYKNKDAVTLDINGEYEEDGQSIAVKVSMYTTENAKFDRVDLEKVETIDIVELSDSELEKEADKIMKNAEKWAEKHTGTINKLVGSTINTKQPAYSTGVDYPYYSSYSY